MKEKTRQALIGVTMGGMCFIIIIFVGLTCLDKMAGIPEQYCKETGGTFVFYECQTIPGATPCSELKTGYWCDYSDGRSINESAIWGMFNSTQMADGL